MLLYRVGAGPYARSISGEGARLYGGRWNPKGTPVLYLSEHPALACLEFLAGVDPALLPDGRAYLLLLDAPFTKAHIEQPVSLPEDWAQEPAPLSAQALGQAWCQVGRKPLLRVPTIHVPQAFNYVLNVLHPLAAKVRLIGAEPFWLSPRVL